MGHSFVRAGPFKVSVLAADSMGVRSLATLVDACGTLIGLDLGASLAPRRYGLPPHELELKALERAMESIREAISEAEGITITHYHYDHFVRDEPQLYAGKRLFVKHPTQDINWSQRLRARRFLLQQGVEKSASVSYADSASFTLGSASLEFSEPVWHGEPGTPVGRVLMVKVSCGDEHVIFASDVQGPADPAAVQRLTSWAGARVLIISGPPTYFAGFKVPVEAVQAGLDGLRQLVRARVAETIVVDHHLLRDLNFSERLRDHYELARQVGVRLVNAAELMGVELNQLEARRRELWGRKGGEEGGEEDYD
ncbi:MAG: hypothetical protein ACP5FT_01330 [Acidilobus sp.]